MICMKLIDRLYSQNISSFDILCSNFPSASRICLWFESLHRFVWITSRSMSRTFLVISSRFVLKSDKILNNIKYQLTLYQPIKLTSNCCNLSILLWNCPRTRQTNQMPNTLEIILMFLFLATANQSNSQKSYLHAPLSFPSTLFQLQLHRYSNARLPSNVWVSSRLKNWFNKY